MPSLLDIPEDTGVLDALGDLYRRVTGGTPSMPAGAANFPYEANPVGTSSTRPQYASDATNQPFDPVAGHGLPVTRGQLAGIARDAWQTAGAVSDGGIGTPAGLLGAIKAYHGSPHSFDRFDMSKIGTGEGAQAYGHGLYFAGNEGVARSYRDTLTKTDAPLYQGNPIGRGDEAYGVGSWMNAPLKPGETMADYLARRAADVEAHGKFMSRSKSRQDQEAAGMYFDAATKLRAANPADWAFPQGHMYEVNLDVEPHQLLDWDKYMKEQPAKLQAIAAAHPELAEKLAPFGLGSYPGGRIHAELADKLAPGNFAAGQVAASNALRDAGIPGIKYLDAGSRGAGTGTSNFVMFDDKFIKILRKYGLIGTAGGGAAAAAGGNQEQSQ